MRRGYLYAKAKELGCNKIALGHHKSDVIETTLMAMLYGGQIQGMLPRLKSKNFDGLELIRPLYCVNEQGFLYSKAQELGCNKIALGHHLSDVLETTLLGLFYGAQLQTMPPKLRSRNFPGMELIRPLYCVNEQDVLKWKEGNGLDFIACACKFTENTAKEAVFSARKRVKQLIAELKKENPCVEDNIFQSIHNVQLDTLVRYKTNGTEVSFLQKFDD